ncbi:sigma-70 family RNA polymerase sigma factor [Chitinophaga sp. Mgbs1]|uniref:Sigma-70 family RNA polymerase sigma factor n=1 Tax=Chitinophaga solisilvae TaxID=1233460 RepID=A0A3S1JI81_9BACT|nr:sigma-70 family RNA polymerase sigma factor [Chitinophaga solisilvae]
MNTTDKQERFLTVLQAHKGIIYKIANAYCQEAENRKDLIQEITVQLWKSFDHYDSRYRYSTWIYRIALNTAISFFRKERRRRHAAELPPDDILEWADTDDRRETDDRLRQLQLFIAELKEMDKALLLLYLEEKSQREIAEITGLSETNVSTRISRIKGILKQKFSTIKN